MIRSNKTLACLMVALISGLLAAGRAHAASVNVDISSAGTPPAGTFSSTGAAPDTGTTWNAVFANTVPITSGALVDSGGAATTVTLALTDSHSHFDATPFNTAPFAPALLNDFAVANQGAGVNSSFTISGLVVNGRYDLYLYAENGGFRSQPTKFTIGSNVQLVNNTANFAAIGSGFVLGGNYAYYYGLKAVGGSISGTWTGNGTNNGAFNGFQILATVPEPASLMLLLAAGPLLLRRGNRGMV